MAQRLPKHQDSTITSHTCPLILAFTCCWSRAIYLVLLNIWLLSPDLMLSEQWWRQLGGLWQRTWIWSPGLRSWLCHLQARCFPMSFSFLGLYFLVPKWANDLAGKLGGLRWGATWKVLLERKRQWLLQLGNVHGKGLNLYHLRLQSVTGNRDSRTQVPWI